jgi:hypothetical protein
MASTEAKSWTTDDAKCAKLLQVKIPSWIITLRNWNHHQQSRDRGGPSKGHRCTQVPLMIFAKQSKLVGKIHAYTLVTRSDPKTDSGLGFGCSVSHIRKGRPRGGRTWWCSSPAKGPKMAWAPGLGRLRRSPSRRQERQRERAHTRGG